MRIIDLDIAKLVTVFILLLLSNFSLALALVVDKNNKLNVGGRIMYDYNQAQKNGVTDEDSFGIRRARLYVSGGEGDFSYKAQFNLGDNNGGTPEDLYIRYNGLKGIGKVTIGRHKVSLGLEELTSSKDISVLERSAVTEQYAIGRQYGISLSGGKNNFVYAINLFEDSATSGDDFGFATRVAYDALASKDSVLHLGIAYANRGQGVDVLGVETAYSRNSYHIQSEYFTSSVKGEKSIDGYYIQAGWVLTGESRPYKEGVFKRVKPAGKKGAVEVVVRYEDGYGNFSDIELSRGEVESWGVGVNWYYTKDFRLGVNYTRGDRKTSTDSGDEFRVRVQYIF